MDIDPFCQPSLPLTKKWRTPHVACVAMFYSEDTEQVYHVFSTDDLHASLATRSRFQTASLRRDPSVRVAWIVCPDNIQRKQLVQTIRDRYELEYSD